MRSAYTIDALYIYPIKGLKGVSVSSIEALQRGAADDRRYMLVDEQGQLVSQRTHPIMCLMSCELKEDVLVVSYKEEKLSFSRQEYTDRLLDVELWGGHFKAYEVSQRTSDWFSQMLGTTCRLVKMVDGEDRIKNYQSINTNHKGSTKLSFADGYPYLVLGTASMQELNSRLEEELPVNRFRPNIVINTGRAHEEDEWEQIMVNEVLIEIVKPCARCVVITIDQATAEKGKEPLKTLAAYRKEGKSIMFGANAVLLNPGKIKVGDPVQLVKS